MTLTSINKTLYLGSYPVAWRSAPLNVYAKVTFDNGRLSISGVESPMRDGNCAGGCGQIIMHLREDKPEWAPADNWTVEMIVKFLAIWDRWHLNDMNAGNQRQMEYLRENPIETPAGDWYGKACAALEAAGLLVNDGYKFGTARKHEDVPADVLEWLAALPAPLKTPAWV